jgi:hypothetical protein
MVRLLAAVLLVVTSVPSVVDAPPPTYRIYATREGLVGRTTSNGHVITSRDHFVSLPSTKSVSPRGSGTYTAKVCRTDGGRCEYAPVWDVGPWNTRDDFWSPSRTEFPALPQGVPEAQAAFQDGFNGGKDSRGRKVTNPAGMDLADGVFWDGLGLTGSTWVDVTLLWTGVEGVTGTVTATVELRAGPSPSAAVVGLAAAASRVPVLCRSAGWDRLAADEYVAAGSVTGADDSPECVSGSSRP